MRVLGIDASTSCVGYAVIESDDLSLVDLGFISLKKYIGLLDKTDFAISEIAKIINKNNVANCPIWIEEAVIGFSAGMSSAQTISTLVGFNAMVTYATHSQLKLEVKHVKPGDARRACGLVLTTKKKAQGENQKQQVYRQLTSVNGLLKDINFPLKKTGKPKDENYDQADAYVVARYGALKTR